MFIKCGGKTDGKIVNVLNEEQLTEDQKQSVKIAVKQSNKETDSSQEKNSGS
jgi:hypothetical protein